MKRKGSLVFFIIFLLIAAFAGYKFISAELDFRSAVDYYDNLADTWVKTNAPKAEPDPVTAAPADDQQPSFPESVSAVPETDESRAVPSSPVQEQNDTPVPVEDRKKEETTSDPAVLETEAPPATAKSENEGHITDTPEAKVTPAAAVAEEESASESPAPESAKSDLPDSYQKEQNSPDLAEESRYTAEQPPVTVDFDGLCAQNPEIVGWIYCEDTPINYPVLQASDNKKYLKVQPDGKTSGSGAVFIDCNCRHDFTSDNTIMYGHNLKNKMFSCLSKYSSQSYYDAHSVMWLLTPGGNYRIELFAGFVIKDGGRVYVIDLFTPQDWTDFTGYCLRSSKFTPFFQPVPGDRLITLSTCDSSFENARYVVIGSLVPSVKE